MNYLQFLEDVCITDITYVATCPLDRNIYPLRNNGRKHCGLIYTLEGTEKYCFKDKTLFAIPKSILFIPKHEAYHVELEDPKSVVIYIDLEFESFENYRPFVVPFKETTIISTLFTDIEKVWKKRKIGYKAECLSLIYKIISLTQKQNLKVLHPKNFYKIKPAIDYLHTHYTDNEFKITELYTISEISPKYFNTLFFKNFNMSPREYVTFLKINQAKEMLKNEKYNISDISKALGYTDVFQFSKIFKKKTSYSPSEYRKTFI